MITFTLNKKANFHLTECDSPLKINGCHSCSGPQNDEMLPPAVLELFNTFPNINTISLSGENSGRVWNRNINNSGN